MTDPVRVVNATIGRGPRRLYPRKFDWDEAKRLRGEGWPIATLAAHYGVTPAAVQRVLDPMVRARMQAAVSARQRSGTCPECGAQTTRRGRESLRCRDCFARAQATSVRPDELRCVSCGEWRPDDDYCNARGAAKLRRGRHHQCRECQTAARRAYRVLNPEARERENAERRVRAARARKAAS